MESINKKLLILFFLLIGFLAFSIGRDYLNQVRSDSDGLLIAASQKEKTGRVLAEEDANSEDEDKIILKSEDYRLEQLNFGGGFSVDITNQSSDEPLVISEVRNEVVTDKENDEIKVLLHWKTSRPVISQVDYGRSGESLGNEIKEDDYTYTHAVLLAKLDPSSVYNYVIHARDVQGNAADSDRFVFYTGAPRVSLLDVLEGAASKAFGWAIRK